jgi:hypothetical protein
MPVMNETNAKMLISLKPINVGTDMAESLESYVQRVANAHHVPRYFVDLLVESNTDILLQPKRASNPTCLNTPSKAVQHYVLRLAELTGRSEARYLGLGSLNGALSQLKLNRSHKAWCVVCLAEWNEEQKTPYWPQVWAFPQYSTCHVHNVVLENKCKKCGTSFPPERPWRAELDKCPACRTPLYSQTKVSDTKNQGGINEGQKIPEYVDLVGYALGKLVSNIQTIAEDDLEVGTKFSLLIEHCRKYDLAKTPADLARIAQLSPPTIHNLQHNEHAHSLDNLLRIAVIAEISLAGLLCPKLWKTTASEFYVQEKHVKLPSSNKRDYYDWDQIGKQVLASIDAGTAEVPWKMARSMGLCEKQFCLKLGKTVHRLRSAAISRKLSESADAYEVMKVKLAKELELAKWNRQKKGRLTMAKKLNVGAHNPLLIRAYAELNCSLLNRRPIPMI